MSKGYEGFDSHNTTMKYLTTSQKDRFFPAIYERDGAYCFFCKGQFDDSVKTLKRTFDHLDDDRTNNDISNLVLCHWKCNQLKKEYPDFKFMAADKAKELQASFDSLGVSELNARTPKTTSKEIDLNVAMKKLTKQYLFDRLVTQGKEVISWSDVCHSISYICYSEFGHGSSETIKRYLLDFTSSAGPYIRVEESGEWIIRKR